MNIIDKYGLKILFFFTLIMATGVQGYAQKELQINYKVENGCCLNRFKIESVLKANNSCVLYHESAITGIVGPPGEEYTKTLLFSHVFKNLQTNTMWSNEEKYVVKEKMDLFQWNFISGKDHILGYKCRKAEANFRGRNYTVWYTTDIPFKAAPWKICGLPGVVLKLKSSDDFYTVEATNIAITDVKKELKMLFKAEKSITWVEYATNYKKDYEAREKSLQALGIKIGRSLTGGPSPNIEIIIEKNREAIKNTIKESDRYHRKSN